MNAFFKPKTCCCCFTPRKATLLMGTLMVMFSLAGLVLGLLNLVNLTPNCELSDSLPLLCHLPNYTVYCCLGTVLLTAILLIVGVTKCKPYWMVPAILINYAIVIIGTLGSPSIFLLHLEPIGTVIITFILWIGLMVFALHWTLISSWYYIDLLNQKENDTKIAEQPSNNLSVIELNVYSQTANVENANSNAC